VRPVHANLAPVDLEVVQIPHSIGCRVCVLKVCETETLGFASVGIGHQPEFDDGARITEDLDDVFLTQVEGNVAHKDTPTLTGSHTEGGERKSRGTVSSREV